jgi:hypothetical protein
MASVGSIICIYSQLSNLYSVCFAKFVWNHNTAAESISGVLVDAVLCKIDHASLSDHDDDEVPMVEVLDIQFFDEHEVIIISKTRAGGESWRAPTISLIDNPLSISLVYCACAVSGATLCSYRLRKHRMSRTNLVDRCHSVTSTRKSELVPRPAAGNWRFFRFIRCQS